MPASSDRRAYPRLHEKHKVSVAIVDCPGDKALQGRTFSCATMDLSVGGLQFFSRRAIPVGTMVQLSVKMTRPLEVFEREGKVVWSRQTASDKKLVVGVHFTDRSREVLAAWRRMLARRA
jgi:hypothetical protein